LVVVPGFLAGADAYGGMKLALQSQGFTVHIAPVSRSMWYPTLFGRPFSPVLEAIDAAVEEASASSASGVALVAHSAAGWLCRLWLGSATYNGSRYDGAKRVSLLLTLGTPHVSAEAYPFGRVRESRSGEDDAALDEAARGSSLAFTNLLYPGSFHDDVRYVSVIGDAIEGGGFPPLDSFLAASSYAANTGGSGEGARGDGITPIECASLEGAENVTLKGVYHQAPSEPWYGSPEVVERWAPLLLEPSAIQMEEEKGRR